MCTRVIGLDFDDTLYPTTMVDDICPTGSSQFVQKVTPAISSIDSAAAALLEECMEVPNCAVALITNGSMMWLSIALRTSPALRAMIEKGTRSGALSIVSARDKFSATFPRQKLQWKVKSWEEVAGPHVSYILTVGDSHLDGQAPEDMCRARGTCRVRFVRMHDYESIPGMLHELRHTREHLRELLPPGDWPPRHAPLRTHEASNLLAAASEMATATATR